MSLLLLRITQRTWTRSGRRRAVGATVMLLAVGVPSIGISQANLSDQQAIAAAATLQHASSATTATSSPTTRVARLAGTPVAVRTCVENASWMRPDEASMARTVWADNRYRNPDGSVPPRQRAYYDRHFVVFATPGSSGVSHALDLTGMMTANPFPPGALCGWGGDQLVQGREVAIWAIGYHIADAAIADEVLTVLVTPNTTTTRGFHIVQMSRPSAQDWHAHFVQPNGTEAARWATTDGELTAAAPSSVGCTGAIIGRLVWGYGDHRAAEGEWIQITNMPDDPDGHVRYTRTGPDGRFRVNGVPLGSHQGMARHARFQFEMNKCGEVLDLREVQYPLVHPVIDRTAAK